MVNSDDLKKGILDEFSKKAGSDKRIKRILEKIQQGSGTYKDVSELASITGRSIGEIVIASLLDQGELPEEVVKKTLQSSFRKNHSIVSEAIRKTQTSMNENAEIGISAIVPKFNTNRSNGLAKLFAEKDKYSDFAKTFAEYAESMSMAAVDDAVRQNAKFHFDSGMSPKITRTTDGKCCEWCSKIAGTYDYEYVKGKGNDIFRRHRCCRCVVEYIPHKGKAVNVHTKKEVPREAKKVVFKNIEDVTAEYLKNARTKKSITIEPGIDPKTHASEISTAKWISELFGGDIRVLKDINEQNQKTPDYIWNGKYWELKGISSENSIDRRMQYAIKQLNGGGGIIFEAKNSTLEDDRIMEIIDRRSVRRIKDYDVDIMVKRGERLVKVVRKKK